MYFSDKRGLAWRPIYVCLIFAAVLISAPASSVIHLRMQTDLGGLDLELFDVAAPLTVQNFMNYVNRGAIDGYDGTFIHRSVPGFVVQGGGYIFNPADGDFFGDGTTQIPTDQPVINEADPVNRPNVRGTIAMAKKADPDSATSQWFFNLADNPGLDDPGNSGGFTVFGHVIGNGMETMDEIAGKPRCVDYFFIDLGQCNGIISFSETPLLYMTMVDPFMPPYFANSVTPLNIVQIINVGTDADSDGIIDRVEDAGPNNGDANNDGLPDSGQSSVASFESESGDYLYLESPTGTRLESMEVMGQTYGLTTFSIQAPPLIFEGTNIAHGYIAFELKGIVPGGAATVMLTLPEGQQVAAYFMYGPTPDNVVPHWYRFDYDGETGAEVNGNEVSLHYVDGLRGDSDLEVNGVIVDPGTPALKSSNSAASGGGGSGCSIFNTSSSTPAQAGAWWLLLLLFSTLGIRLRVVRQEVP